MERDRGGNAMKSFDYSAYECIKHPPDGSKDFLLTAIHVEVAGSDELCDHAVIAVFDKHRRPKTVKEISQLLMGVRRTSAIKRSVQDLMDRGLLYQKEMSPEEICSLLSSKKLKGKGIGFASCAWCQVSTVATQSHHYPKKRNEGGEETVDICGSCHFEYHQIERGLLIYPSDLLIKKLNKVTNRYFAMSEGALS